MASIVDPSPDSNKAPRRKAISPRLRFEILRRDNHTCRYCGGQPPEVKLTVDHVLPVTLGGTDDPSNLCAACTGCNAGKSSSSPEAATVARVSNDAARWAEAMKLAAERLNASKTTASEQTKPFHDAWFLFSGPGWSYRLPGNADEILIGYLAAGMPPEVLADAARIALRKRGVENYWHYFQGVAKNMLADLQRDAQALLADEESPSVVQCDSCGRPRSNDRCCFMSGWTVGITDCSVVNTDPTKGERDHPDHYVMMALSRVVDAPAHEWASTWPYPSELYPTYTGRV